MKNQKVKSERMWMVWNPSIGFFHASNDSTKKGAQARHCADMGYSSWKHRDHKEDKAVPVIVKEIKK